MTVSVPGCVRGWGMLLERFGTRPLAALLGPAILGMEVFRASGRRSQAIDEFASLTPDPEWHRVFRAAGRAPRLGEPLVQSDLARTLRDLGAEGPDLFYTGRVGRAIADRMAADGFLGPEDLAEHAGEWGEPIATTYHGFRVYETPPPTQGLAALIALNILDRFPLARRPLHSVQHLHLLLEVVKLAYADRDRWIGDPAHARVPLAELLDKKYAARRRKAFDARKAHALSTMGGNGQAMFHVQILTNLIDYGFDPQEAIERPRFLIGAFLPGEPADTIHLESRVPRPVASALVRKGHPIKPAPEFFTRTGHAHAISFRDGTMLGGADPRGDGAALGF